MSAEPRPKVLTRTVIVRMDVALYEALQRNATAHERTVSQSARHLLRKALR